MALMISSESRMDEALVQLVLAGDTVVGVLLARGDRVRVGKQGRGFDVTDGTFFLPWSIKLAESEVHRVGCASADHDRHTTCAAFLKQLPV